MIREYDVLQSASGVDIEGTPKSTVVITINKQNGTNVTEAGSFTTANAVVNFYRTNMQTIITLTFENAMDTEFKELANLLIENSNMKDNMLTAITISVFPKELKDKYLAIGVDASWCITASAANILNDSVRFFIPNQLFHALEMMDEE